IRLQGIQTSSSSSSSSVSGRAMETERLEQQVASVERGMALLQREHLAMLGGLQLEITRLKRRCHELNCELDDRFPQRSATGKMLARHRDIFDDMKERELAARHRVSEGLLEEQESVAAGARVALRARQLRVRALGRGLQASERRFLEELKRRGHQITALGRQLDRQTLAAAALRHQLRGARTRLRRARGGTGWAQQQEAPREGEEVTEAEPEDDWECEEEEEDDGRGASAWPLAPPPCGSVREQSVRACVPRERVTSPQRPRPMPDPALFLAPLRYRLLRWKRPMSRVRGAAAVGAQDEWEDVVEEGGVRRRDPWLLAKDKEDRRTDRQQHEPEVVLAVGRGERLRRGEQNYEEEEEEEEEEEAEGGRVFHSPLSLERSCMGPGGDRLQDHVSTTAGPRHKGLVVSHPRGTMGNGLQCCCHAITNYLWRKDAPATGDAERSPLLSTDGSDCDWMTLPEDQEDELLTVIASPSNRVTLEREHFLFPDIILSSSGVPVEPMVCLLVSEEDEGGGGGGYERVNEGERLWAEVETQTEAQERQEVMAVQTQTQQQAEVQTQTYTLAWRDPGRGRRVPEETLGLGPWSGVRPDRQMDRGRVLASTGTQSDFPNPPKDPRTEEESAVGNLKEKDGHVEPPPAGTEINAVGADGQRHQRTTGQGNIVDEGAMCEENITNTRSIMSDVESSVDGHFPPSERIDLKTRENVSGLPADRDGHGAERHPDPRGEDSAPARAEVGCRRSAHRERKRQTKVNAEHAEKGPAAPTEAPQGFADSSATDTSEQSHADQLKQDQANIQEVVNLHEEGFAVRIQAPGTETFELQVSGQMLVTELHQVLMDHEMTCQRTCFSLQLGGAALDALMELRLW
ncbi:hypothetical protein CRUP_015451, partial [Coryphaenoides rupestris]